MNNKQPDYKRIYSDIVDLQFPEKKDDCKKLLSKARLSAIDILLLNEKIFGKNKNQKQLNQRHASYTKHDILIMLEHQKKHNLNNTELARHFSLSRNSIARWKKIFLV